MKRFIVKKSLWCILCMLILFTLSVSHASETAYTVKTNTYYINPDTGVTDDGGSKNAAIGEGMCRSVLHEMALIEEQEGRTWATFRMQLLSNIESLKFMVQMEEGNPDSYYEVEADIIQEDAVNDSGDFRLEIPHVGAYVRCTAYIIPMSRDVCFYYNTDKVQGEEMGDFIVTEDKPLDRKLPMLSKKVEKSAMGPITYAIGAGVLVVGAVIFICIKKFK